MIQNISVASIVTGDVTLTGVNFLGSDSLASATMTSSDGKSVYLMPSSAATATSLTFNVNSTIVSGKYLVRVRNDYG
jgi:hypothetical protein